MDDRALLDFAALTWHHAGSKDAAIRERFGITPTEFYRRLNLVIDQPESLAYSPTLVNRLRRMRTSTLRRRGVTAR